MSSIAPIDQSRTLLSHIPALQRPCDLDLLVFLATHPRTLIPVEQLAQLLGYPPRELARSLDVLSAAGLLTQTQRPARATRMFVLSSDAGCGSLPDLVELASTRDGRLALKRALTHAATDGGEGRADGRS